MRLIHVVPLARGVFKEELSYFSSKKIEPGTLVAAPLRGKRAPALVVGSEEAVSAKAYLRSLPYQMKKIEETTDVFLFLPSFVRAARKAARHFATTTGEVIQAFTPKTILAESTTSRGEQYTASGHVSRRRIKEGLSSEAYVFQADDAERMSAYKSLIREQFAQHASVFFCLPTTQDIERVAGSLERGIKEYTYVLHSGLSKKALTTAWSEALSNEHPVLIVATASFLSLPREDIKTLIVDREHASSYKNIARPRVDARIMAEYIAREQNIRLIFGDILLRPETLFRHERGEFLEFAPLKFRSLAVARQEIVDMREYGKDSMGEFVATSSKLHELITKSREANGRLAILVSRRGLAPLTVCSDCGAPVSCAVCKVPLVLHAADQKKTYYMCHSCGRQESSEVTCAECSGWRLKTLGVGLERAYKEISEQHPGVPLFRLDSDTARSPKKAIEIMKKFTSTPGAVLIGTEMLVHYLDQPIENAAVYSIDSLFTIPDYKINEKVFHLLLALRTKTQKTFLVQTRNPDQPVFSYVFQGNLVDFYREELASRKRFAYPPFSTCIKITLGGKRETVAQEMKKVEELLAEYEPVRYPSFIETKHGVYREHMLLRLKPEVWIDEKLLGLLRRLPPFFDIAVDPDSLL